jgi:hypothetical protein
MNDWLFDWEMAINKIDPGEVMRFVLNNHKEDIIDLNQKQLSKGIDSQNNRLHSYSSPYASWRKKKGLQTENTDLKVHGDFYKYMYVALKKTGGRVGSTDGKEGVLEWRYGEDIFWLTKDSQDILLWERGVANEFSIEYIRRVKAA